MLVVLGMCFYYILALGFFFLFYRSYFVLSFADISHVLQDSWGMSPFL